MRVRRKRERPDGEHPSRTRSGRIRKVRVKKERQPRFRKGQLRRYAADGLFYLVGSVLYALSVNIFSAPNNIAPGGVTGLATVLNYLFNLPIGTTIWVMNIPLMLAAWKRIGLEFTIRTTICTTIVSLVIDLTEPYIPAFVGEHILTVIFGGVLAGAGLGLIYMRGGTTGGSEVVARLLERKFRHIPIGRLILVVDFVVVALAAVVYHNVESAMFAIIMIYVSSILMDTMIYGQNKGKMLLIITKHEPEVAHCIIQNMHRGVTMLKAAGAYTGLDRQVLMCAVRPSEVYQLRTLVYDYDPEAFIVVVPTDEVLGEGFKQLTKR